MGHREDFCPRAVLSSSVSVAPASSYSTVVIYDGISLPGADLNSFQQLEGKSKVLPESSGD